MEVLWSLSLSSASFLLWPGQLGNLHLIFLAQQGLYGSRKDLAFVVDDSRAVDVVNFEGTAGLEGFLYPESSSLR